MWHTGAKTYLYHHYFNILLKLQSISVIHCSHIGIVIVITQKNWGCHGRDRMVDGFTTTYAISAYHH
jgi:hypothetical protein